MYYLTGNTVDGTVQWQHLNQYIKFIYIENIVKISFICCFIVTAKNLTGCFLFFCSWWLAEEYLFAVLGTQMVSRCPMLNNYFIKLKKCHQMFSIKMLFLKILSKTLHLNCFYDVIVWNFVSGLHLKLPWLSNITKIPAAFNSKL